MTLNDLLRQGRSITEQLNSGDIPLIDTEGKEVNIELALHQTKDKLVCEMAFVRRGPDDRVEPKFGVGDWVMYKNGACFSDGSISARVQSIKGHKVWLGHGTYVDESELKK